MGSYSNLLEANYGGVGKYNIPMLDPVLECDDLKWLSFNFLNSTKCDKAKTGVTFWIDDHLFDRVWNYPFRYMEMLKGYNTVLSPDFSLYNDMPLAVQIYNKWRNNWLARYYQDNGIKVVPSIVWSDERSYEFAFEGIPKGSIVSVSNVGCMREKKYTHYFNKGYNKMLEVLEPKEILFFAHKFDNYDGNVRFIRYNEHNGG